LTEQIQNDCYETQTILVISNSNKAMIIFFFVCAHDSLMLSVKAYHHQVLVCTVFKHQSWIALAARCIIEMLLENTKS